MIVQTWTIKDIKKRVEELGRHYDVWNQLPPIEKLVLQPLSNEPREGKFRNMRSIAFLAKDNVYKVNRRVVKPINAIARNNLQLIISPRFQSDSTYSMSGTLGPRKTTTRS
jgi:hypothetical protein